MASRALFTIADGRDRAEVLDLVIRAPLGTRVEFKAQKRTLPQSDLMWGLLTDVSRQATHHGRKYTAEIWKLIFLNALGRRTIFVPVLEGEGLFPVGPSSADLSTTEMADLITSIVAWGDQNGVVFKQKPLPPGPPR